MRKMFLLALSFLLWATPGAAIDGLVALKSPYPAPATMDRLQTLVQQKGLTVFARIDHAKGAAAAGLNLRPTEVILFGNPQGGTPFMECAQTAGIDLPLKVLVWEDESGQTWLGYNDPAYLARRHQVPDCPVVPKLAGALAAIAARVVAP